MNNNIKQMARTIVVTM